MQEHNNSHGGSRPGAGRPPLPLGDRKETKSVTLPRALWVKIDRIRGKRSRSAFLTESIKIWLK